jgi:hypothetical protein
VAVATARSSSDLGQVSFVLTGDAEAENRPTIVGRVQAHA